MTRKRLSSCWPTATVWKACYFPNARAFGTFNSTMFSCFSWNKIDISLIELIGMPSRSFSILTLFSAAICPSSTSRALVLVIFVVGKVTTDQKIPVNNAIGALADSVQFFEFGDASFEVETHFFSKFQIFWALIPSHSPALAHFEPLRKSVLL